MSFPSPSPTLGDVPDDDAVTFLTSLMPTSPAERSRAFSALLRALTATSIAGAR